MYLTAHIATVGLSRASKRGRGVVGSDSKQRRVVDVAQRKGAGIGCLRSLTLDRNMSYTYLCCNRLTGVFKRSGAWRLSAKLKA